MLLARVAKTVYLTGTHEYTDRLVLIGMTDYNLREHRSLLNFPFSLAFLIVLLVLFFRSWVRDTRKLC